MVNKRNQNKNKGSPAIFRWYFVPLCWTSVLTNSVKPLVATWQQPRQAGWNHSVTLLISWLEQYCIDTFWTTIKLYSLKNRYFISRNIYYIFKTWCCRYTALQRTKIKALLTYGGRGLLKDAWSYTVKNITIVHIWNNLHCKKISKTQHKKSKPASSVELVILITLATQQ